MSGPGPPRRTARAGPARRSPQRLEEALLRALDHARAAAGEAALAARALLDAASLGATGAPAAAHEPLRSLLRRLEELAASGGGGRWLAALGAALDGEIARWESRSRTDPEARGVLRAFLGLRELLWELGLRAEPAADEAPAGAPPRAERPRPRPATRAAATRRLERVPIDGGGPPGRTG